MMKDSGGVVINTLLYQQSGNLVLILAAHYQSAMFQIISNLLCFLNYLYVVAVQNIPVICHITDIIK